MKFLNRGTGDRDSFGYFENIVTRVPTFYCVLFRYNVPFPSPLANGRVGHTDTDSRPLEENRIIGYENLRDGTPSVHPLRVNTTISVPSRVVRQVRR